MILFCMSLPLLPVVMEDLSTHCLQHYVTSNRIIKSKEKCTFYFYLLTYTLFLSRIFYPLCLYFLSEHGSSLWGREWLEERGESLFPFFCSSSQQADMCSESHITLTTLLHKQTSGFHSDMLCILATEINTEMYIIAW